MGNDINKNLLTNTVYYFTQAQNKYLIYTHNRALKKLNKSLKLNLFYNMNSNNTNTIIFLLVYIFTNKMPSFYIKNIQQKHNILLAISCILILNAFFSILFFYSFLCNYSYFTPNSTSYIDTYY